VAFFSSFANFETELARKCREVTRLTQADRIRGFPEFLGQRSMFEVAPMAVFVEPRHYIGPTCHAYSGGIIMMIKGHAVRSQAVNMRRFYILVTVTTQGVTALVISK